jgi:hypothetical protein
MFRGHILFPSLWSKKQESSMNQAPNKAAHRQTFSQNRIITPTLYYSVVARFGTFCSERKLAIAHVIEFVSVV